MTGTNTHGTHVGFTSTSPRMKAWTAPGSARLSFTPQHYRIRGAWRDELLDWDDEPSL